MDDEAVDARGHRSVRDGLEAAGMMGPGALGRAVYLRAVRGEGLGRTDRLAVKMADGGGFAYVGLADEIRGVEVAPHPEFGHGDVGVPLEVHPVRYEGALVAVRFGMPPEAAGGEQAVYAVVMLLGQQLAQGLPPVGEKAFRPFRRPDHGAGDGGQPAYQVITPARAEFFRHGGGPGLAFGLVTVQHYVFYDAPQPAAAGIVVQGEIVGIVSCDRICVIFVHLQAGSLG